MAFSKPSLSYPQRLVGYSHLLYIFTPSPTSKPLMRRLFLLLLLVPSLAACASTTGIPPTQTISPGPCRVKTDMELASLYSLPTDHHSRTRLPDYSHVSDGVTPATLRLQGGRGYLRLPAAWQDYVARLNNHNAIVLKYLFHPDSGWQNSDEYGQVEELAFEDQWVNVLSVSGSRAYIQTFFSDQTPPAQINPNDRRQQLFTIITRDDRLIGSPKGDAWIILIARPAEKLWIPVDYLACPDQPPSSPFFPQ